MNKKVRVRFAPSPTGPLHIGGMRTALFNYLFARKHHGDMILRIEDTDQKRYVRGAEEYIMEALAWCGITLDEGIRQGGDAGPYRQSERKAHYRAHADRLLKSGHAYYAFDTPEDLERIRKEREARGMVFTYDASVRHEMNNALALSPREVDKKLKGGAPFVVRFRIPEDITIRFDDIIRGHLEVETATLDDKILFKSDGMPTYHLANVVDDHLMGISHVIRGEEWLPSLPLHILLYRAFGWEPPEFAHMPLTLKPDGKGKLSKRDGDRLGFPVFPLQWTNPDTGEISSGYRESGYFPEAFVNILAFLGWNPGTTQELFSMEELIEAFSLGRVIKSGSRFDPDKARWFNQQYLRKKDDLELARLFQSFLKQKDIHAEDQYVAEVCALVKERAAFVNELWDHSYFFFRRPESYDEKIIRKRWDDTTPGIMTELAECLEQAVPFKSAHLEKLVKSWITDKNYNMGSVLNVCRLLMVGTSSGPHLFDIFDLLGKKETIARIKVGMKSIENHT